MTTRGLKIDNEISSLLKLAYLKKADDRSVLFNNIIEVLERRHTEFSVNECQLMSDILERLIKDVEMNVRINLANRLASQENTPVSLILLLANDDIEVAKPILSLNELLSDEDLVKIVRHKTVQHHMSIAGRKSLSSDICRELVSIGNTNTLITLIKNKGAEIDEETFSILVDKSENNQPIQSPLIERPDLPRSLSLKMYQWVSNSLRDVIALNLDLNAAEIDEILAQTVKDAQKQDQNHITKEFSEKKLVRKLYNAGELSPSFLMKSLQNGQASLFEIAFAKLVNIPHKVMRSFLYDRGADALAVACVAVGIDKSVFLTIYSLTREAQDMDTNISDDEISKAFEYFSKLNKKSANFTLQKWVAEATGGAIF